MRAGEHGAVEERAGPTAHGGSGRWEVPRARFEPALREARDVPDETVTVAVTVSLDGVMVPMTDREGGAKQVLLAAAQKRG